MQTLEQSGWLIGISSAVSMILGVLCTKGVDALLKMRKAKSEEHMEEKKYEDGQEAVAFQQATAAYEKLLAAFESRVQTLETALQAVTVELKESRKEHTNCAVEQERLRGEIKVLQIQVDRLKDHDLRNQQQIEKSHKDLQTVEQKIEAGK